MSIKDKITIPNILSAYRILTFPIVLYFALTLQEKAFAILLIINLVTDILDGLIARLFKMQTEFGARLDSIADIGTYILAVSGIFIFKAPELKPHITIFYVFIFFFLIANILSLLKFKRLPSLHLYSWKIGGYLQGGFFFLLFAFGFFEAYFYIVMIWGILAFSEHIIIQLILKQMKSNQRGLYWVLKEKND